MPVTSWASWYCCEYRERKTRRKSGCQSSNVIVGLLTSDVERAIQG